MSNDKKEYEVPDEIKELFLDHLVALGCRDKCIQSCWRAKRAIYYGKIAEQALAKAWCLFGEIYPETKNKPMTYERNSQTVKPVKNG